MRQMQYERVLLKLSGEALAGPYNFGIDPTTIRVISQEIVDVAEQGAQVALVIGGGNIFRGVSGSAKGMERSAADYMGMMATVMNAVAVQDNLEKLGLSTRVMSAITMREVAEPIREATLEDTRGEGENLPENEEGEDGEIPGADDPRMEEIEEVLEREIMPYLEGDGGGLAIKGLVDDKLMIDYQGACGSCPASITGTLMSIENLLKKEVDEGLTVEAIGSAPGTGGGMAGPGMPYGM